MLVYEANPIWDENKERIIGNESNSFDIKAIRGNSLPYQWWRLQDDNNEILGYGWLKTDEDSIEISLSIAKEHRGKGLSKQILIYLEQQILSENLPRNIVATVYESNKDSDRVVKLLRENGYKTASFPTENAEAVLRKGIDVTFYKTL